MTTNKAYAIYYDEIDAEGNRVGRECSLHPTLKAAAAYSKLHEGPDDCGFETVAVRHEGKLAAFPVKLSDRRAGILADQFIIAMSDVSARRLEKAGKPIFLGAVRRNPAVYRPVNQYKELVAQSYKLPSTIARMTHLHHQICTLGITPLRARSFPSLS